MRWLALLVVLLAPVAAVGLGVISGPDPRQMRGVGVIQGGVLVTNYFLNSIAPASMQKSGTPVISGNEVTDDDAAAAEGVFSGCQGTVGPRAFSCFVRAGTTTNATLRFNTNGTGGTSCAITGLTATAQRVTCTTTIGGSPTFTNAIVNPGANLASATGSIFVDQCQCELATMPGVRCDSGATAATCEG